MTVQLLSETAAILADSVHRLLEQALDGERGRASWDAELWSALVEQGVPDALVATEGENPADPEQLGVHGALNLLFVAGRHAAPVPLAEHMVAAWVAGRAGIVLPEGPVVIAGAGWHDRVSSADNLLSGRAVQVPFAREAKAVLVCTGSSVAVVPTAELTMNVHENTAGEARCTIAFDGLRAELKPLPFDSWSLRAAMAGARAFQIAGALDRVLEMTAGYVQEREQFGRPIARFQAVQQSLAELGGQVATARAATTLVSEAFGKPEGVAVLAAAKIRSGEAVGIASRIAHQAHGAIGFTREYDLQRFTRRLWGWREDYGNETNWAKWLGLAITAHQSENHAVPLWEMIAGGLRLPSMVGSI